MLEAINILYDSEIGDVWRHFQRISEIPRPSKHEERIREDLVKIARDENWEIRRDSAGNVVFAIPGCGALLHAPTLVLQGHMDMVCEKNSNVVHDFLKDSIKLRTDGNWVCADGTTLGADNGIAMALMLSIAQRTVQHRVPLELLFTVDEETGLTGAMNLDGAIVKGRMLLNLDSEDDGVLTIGCASGQDLTVSYSKELQVPYTQPPFHKVLIRGLQGGHSGVNIHEERGNAIITAAKFMAQLREQSPRLKILDFYGGNKKNAIPREASFTVANCSTADLNRTILATLNELKKTEEKGEINVQSQTTIPSYNTVPFECINFLCALPNGVIAMDPNFPELVQTSSSVGVVSNNDSGLEVLIHGRSSSKEALEVLKNKLEKLAFNNDGKFVVGAGYPGWRPNPKSKLLQRGKYIYKSLFSEEPKIISMHAGLETGILGDILGTDELLSVGPTIKDAHSPTERLNVKSVENIFHFLEHFVSDQVLASN